MLKNDGDIGFISNTDSSYKIDKNVTLQGNPLLGQYHGNEQKLNKRIVNHAIAMIWVGIAIVVFGIIMVCLKGMTTGIITLVSGAIVEFISGTILVLAKYEINSKDKYFETLSKTQEQNNLMNFINSIENDETRAKCQQQYIEKYMNKFK